MLGLGYNKVAPTTYVLHFKNGQLVREGAGLSFFYFTPTSTIVHVPVSSRDVPFVFNEITADFQDATIQGELSYRIRDPKLLASLLDYSVDANGQYRSDDPHKLDERLVHATQILARSFTQKWKLKELMVSSDPLIGTLQSGLGNSDTVAALGVEILGLSILGISATPEMAKAFQAEAREEMLRRADEAIYARRNVAVELERTIKENEIKTELAVAAGQRNIRESQMAAEIAIEEQRKQLVESKVENERKEAEARAAGLQAMLEPLKSVDWRTLLAANGGEPGQIMSFAFQQLAENASKIGELNISPELLHSLLKKKS
jgi:hypothetical protein